MPYDTNGNYSLPTIYYAISGTVINPSQHNTPLEDLQVALNRTFLRDGTAAMTGNINAGNNKVTNLAKGENDTDAVIVAQTADFMNKSDADKRYLINNGGVSGGLTRAALDEGTGTPSFLDGNGIWHQVAAYGEYATATQLNAEITRATTIESNLQTSIGQKVSKFGDIMSGGLTISGGGGLNVNYDPGGQTTGQTTNYGSINSGSGGRGANFGFYLQELVGSTFNGVWSLSFPDGTYRFFGIPGKSARMNDSSFGDLAYTSDLSNYIPDTTYVSDFATSDVRVTNLPYGQRLISFNVLITTNGQYVPFPEAFSDIPISVVPGDCGNDAGKTDAWPVAAPMQKWTAAGCNIYIGSAAVPRRVSIIAKGSR